MSGGRIGLRLLVAQRLFEGGRLDAAEAALTEADLPLDHPGCMRLQAEITLQKRDYHEARNQFSGLVNRPPSDADMAGAYSGLASSEMGLGDLDAAATSFLEAIKCGANDMRAWLGASEALFALGAWDALSELAERGRASQNIEPATAVAVGIMSAVASFARGDMPRCGHEIAQLFSATGADRESVRKLVVAHRQATAEFGVRARREQSALTAMLSYHDYLVKLLAHYHAHPDLYATTEVAALHIIGDSHCLAAAHTMVSLDGVPYRVDPHPVIGAKAWHLAPALNPDGGPQRAAFERVAQTLPDQTPVIAMFGEIDCRINEGLYPFLTARPDISIETHCADVARAYIAYVRQVLSGRRRVIIYGVPAPDPTMVRKAGDDRRRYVRLVATFNYALGAATRAAGLEFLDPYSVTAGADGAALDHWHFDGIHVAPTLLGTLLEMFAEPVPLS